MITSGHRQPWGLRVEGETIVVELRGDLDGSGAEALERALLQELGGLTPGSARILFDLGPLRGYSLEAREVLARVQRRLASAARRSAWVANRPIFRGLARWIAHHAPDASARTFADEDEARRWLGADETRDAVLMREANAAIERIRGRVSKEAT